MTRSETMKAAWRDPEKAARMTAAIREFTGRPEYRLAAGKRAMQRWKDPELALRMRRAICAGLARPEVRQKLSAIKLKNPSGGSRPVHLTGMMREALIDMRRRGRSITFCAVSIGVCNQICSRWVRALDAA